MTDQDYAYGGDDDNLTLWNRMLTSRLGDGQGHPEEDFLSAIALLAASKAGGAFLDVGVGIGRIIEILQPYAGSVVGLEPDRERWQGCHKGFSPDPRIEMLNMASWDYVKRCGGKQFDYITVSMVVQHVSTGACRQIFSNVHDLLAPNGLALIAATHFFEERFTYESAPQAHDVASFDRYAEQLTPQDKGIPVRLFSREALQRELEQVGLTTVLWREFAYPRPESLPDVAEAFAASVDQIRDRGVSQYVVVRRETPPTARGWLARLRRR